MCGIGGGFDAKFQFLIDAAQDAQFELLVDTAQFIRPLQFPGGEPKAGEHESEEQSVPQLEPPADGVEEFHSMQ